MERERVNHIDHVYIDHVAPNVAGGGRRRPVHTVLGRAGALALLLAAASATQAHAATIHVANSGIDSGACGAEVAPCRTLTQAIALASDGDVVLVGPGVYGDVDGDGDFVSPGDEPAGRSGCNCVVRVNKSVRILSEQGAGATVLRGALGGLFAVAIDSPGVVFGKRKAGFSVIGDAQHDGHGIWVGETSVGTRVEGNTFSRLETALFVSGNRSKVIGNRITQAFGQAIRTEGESISITANVVEQTGSYGAHDAAVHLVGNPGGPNRVERNLVIGNLGIGIFVDNGEDPSAAEPVVRGNLVVGNALTGIKVVLAARSGLVTVTGNSIYANDELRGTNCGLTTLVDGPRVDASGNYWGAPSGPGGNPADDACSAGTPPDVSDPSPTEFVVVAPAMR